MSYFFLGLLVGGFIGFALGFLVFSALSVAQAAE